MYFQLTGAVRDRMISELRAFWQYHPKYRDSLVKNIQGRHAFKERPQQGVIIKCGGASQMTLSADNYMGIEDSYCFLTKYQNYPGVAIEWVREDAVAIQNNSGVFPSPPGIYFIDLIEEDQFVVDVLLDVYAESVQQIDTLNFQLKDPYVAGSLRLYEMPSGWLLTEGVSYTADAATGAITLLKELTTGRWLQADYRTVGDVGRGPFDIHENRANNSAIPGVVLAFANRNEKGDRMAVVVQEIRHPAHLRFGGHWDLSLEFEIFARDIHAQGEIADRSIIYLWGVVRSRLADEGLHMEDISLGGEAEEIYDENADDYYYTCSISMTMKTEWAIFVPLIPFVRQVAPLSSEDIKRISGLEDDQLAEETGRIKVLEELSLEPLTDPFFRGRSSTYELIR